MEKYFIHRFKTRKNFYFYDVNTNRIVQTNEATYNTLGENINNKNTQCQVVKSMQESGLLKENKCEKIHNPISTVIEYYLKNKIKHIILQITQQCNFRCEYCAYSGGHINRKHSLKRMGFDVAKKCIDFYLTHSRNTKNLHISFYGGEPLLELDLIKKCVVYAKEKSEGKYIDFGITTNGSLLNEKTVRYLSKNDFNLTISLDGPKDVHDMHRLFINGNGTFNLIRKNILMIKENYPELYANIYFSAVVDQRMDSNNVSDFFKNTDIIDGNQVLSSTINDIYSKNRIEASEAFVIQNTYEKFISYLSSLNKVEDEYVSPFFRTHTSSLMSKYGEQRKHTIEIQKEEHPGGPCLPGVKRLFVDANGVFHPCERTSEISKPMQIGTIDDGFNMEKVKDILNVGNLTEELCKSCWAYRFCHLCACFADNIDELSKQKRTSYCDEVKFNVESEMIDYCTLLEFGYSENNINKFSQRA